MSSTKQAPHSRRLASWRSVIRAYQTCDRQFAVLLKECGLTTTQFDALSAIEALGDGARLSDVAARLLVTKGNVTGLVQRLQDNELVVIAVAETDRRITFCRLTRKGKSRLAKAQVAAMQFVQHQLSPFTEDECGAVESVMRRMIQQLESMDPKELVRKVAKT